MQTLSDLIERNARLHGDRPCITCGERTYTHARYAARCWSLANAWLAKGVRPGDRVAFLLRNRAEALEVYGAAESAGFVAVPLNWRLAAAELAAVLADCQPQAVVAAPEFRQTLLAACGTARLQPRLTWVDADEDSHEALLAGAPAQRPGRQPGPDDLAHIVYTSGTTGRPKGVMWTHGAVLAGALDLALATGARPPDRIVLPMPLFHVGAKIEWLGVQVVGGSCIVLPQFDELAFFRAVQDQGGNTAHLAPTMVRRLVRHPARTQHDTSGLRRVQYGSAPVRGADLREAVAAFGPVFFQIYGMTEHLTISILSPWDQHLDGTPAQQARLESAGQPFAHTQVRLEGAGSADAATGAEGEILVRSPAQSRGYWGDAAATAESFGADGWLRTGDIGRIDEAGFLYVVDRRKDMVVSGGENVYSREVEDVLQSHPAVAEAAVIGVPDREWGEAVKAVVVLAPGHASLPQEELLAMCRERLAGYKKPRSFDVVPSLPRLAHGKVDKRALRAPYWAGAARRV